MSGDWGVRVNEAGIFATRLGMDWWVQAIAPWEASGRAVRLGACPGRCVWFLPFGAKADAAWAREHIVSHGIPGKFATLVTAAKAGAERARQVSSQP